MMFAARIVVGVSCCAALLLAGCRRTPPVIVGSKTGTEQVLLGEIIAQHLQRRLRLPERIVNRTALGATDLVHTALISGEVDVYPEYTGTALRDVLRETMQSYEPDLVFERVRDVYRSQYHIKWFDPLGFNSRQTAAIADKTPDAVKLATLSDAEARGSGWRIAYPSELASRRDGLSQMSATYRLALSAPPLLVDPAQLYRSISTGAADMIIVRTTDGRLSSGGLKLLADDRNAFPPYEAAIVARESTLKIHPKLASALEELSGKFSAPEMQRMNAEVELERKQPAAVAAEFLARIGLK